MNTKKPNQSAFDEPNLERADPIAPPDEGTRDTIPDPPPPEHRSSSYHLRSLDRMKGALGSERHSLGGVRGR